ncbi:cell division protein ZapA [Pleionea mediterranea]|uniref:Cell division protein ZapA n=1 Tax=Pleionea mediterranea TaxID=523701 RepID=A0A316FZB5_9GAMM|nr:cell division protein ZapA [Pleionea mediterranea]PWK53732.1 cell division protein ZapA [Pleionea mediterranea]
MSQDKNSVTLRILEREYQFSSPIEQRDQLMNAARFLDGRMKEIRDSGRVVGTERIAVMAALNLAFELLNDDKNTSSADSSRLSQLKYRIEEVLASDSQLELT